MKRALIAAAALLAFVVPTGARADSATYTAPYTMGDRGGDAANNITADPATGEVTVLRLGGSSVSGSLGCLATGGYANLVVNHVVGTGVDTVTVNASDVFMDNFTWLTTTVSIVGGYGALATTKLRGPVFGDASIVVPALGPPNEEWPSGERAAPGQTLEIRFGIETASACPSVAGGHALFDSIVVS